jgi:hypothetical protein
LKISFALAPKNKQADRWTDRWTDDFSLFFGTGVSFFGAPTAMMTDDDDRIT